MRPDRFTRVKEILLAIADLPAQEREAYLDRECRGDPELRAEVESMLAHDGHPTAMLGEQAVLPRGLQEASGPSPMIGRTFSHYRILGKLGLGGMGEVYLARDERLEREVALKVLRAGTLADEAARKRFRKEALALSKLNHPNIATVFDFDTQDGVDFLVMEYVAGEELGAGGKPEREVARLGVQLAEGLAAAHGQGIVHRDLKPGNVRLTPDGRLKILDFGLAKLVRPSAETAATETLTEAHALLGTLPYMAPEQLRGESVDERTDIWAAGVVLYEMATGRRAFPETESARLITAILTEPPSMPSAVHRRLSAGLESIIVKCLEKDPERRYQSAKELAVDLRRLEAPSLVRAVRPARPRRNRHWVLAGVASGLVALVGMILALNVSGWRERLFSSVPQIRSLAVLPLTNLAGDSTQAYFSDGMTRTLIDNLGNIAALRVRPWDRVVGYKDSKMSLAAIARELNADAVVTGTVARADNRVRINARMIQAGTERQLWSGSYERDLSDVQILQGGMAQAIANVVRARMSPAERARLAGARTVDPAAYEFFLRGEATQRWGEKAEYCRQAIRIDSTFAFAYARLSSSETWGAVYGEKPPGEAAPQALACAAKAIELDDNLPAAHAALGVARFLLAWDFPGAEREFKRALALNPNDPSALDSYSFFLAYMGRGDEGVPMRVRVWQNDPTSGYAIIVGWCCLYARRYDEAIDWCRKTLTLQPRHKDRWILALAYTCKEMYKEALAQCDTIETFDLPRICADYVYAVAGRQDKARLALSELRRKEEAGEYVAPLAIAMIYAGLGEKELALTYLRKGISVRDIDVVCLKVEPYWDRLRSDPRFDDLLRQVGFPPDAH